MWRIISAERFKILSKKGSEPGWLTGLRRLDTQALVDPLTIGVKVDRVRKEIDRIEGSRIRMVITMDLTTVMSFDKKQERGGG